MASNDSNRSGLRPASRPVIGITSNLDRVETGVWDIRASFLSQVYLQGVTAAGGIAIELPPQPVDAATAASIVDRLDGLLLSGGSDIDPARYGQDPHPLTSRPNHLRDTFESAVIKAALHVELPLLAICRGAQLLNVVRGGDLIQHLPDVVGDERYQLGGGTFNVIEVEVDAGTRIAEVLGQHRIARAHIYHHQAIGALGDGLVVTSRTADGIPQSLELPALPFAIAVQWHPEENAEDRRLFSGLVSAAASRRTLRTHA